MGRYTVTVRYGGQGYRYHTSEVEAADLAEALRAAAADLPDEVRATGDLAEIRPSRDPDGREYLEGWSPSGSSGCRGPSPATSRGR